MKTLLSGARIITPDDDIPRGDVLIEDGRIAAVSPDTIDADGAETVDLTGLILAPGFIDVHVHGGGGFSLCANSPGEIAAHREWVVRTGVTSLLPTICATNVGESETFLAAAAEAANHASSGANILGLNLEGPFVSPDRRGALPKTWATSPDVQTFERLRKASAGFLRMMTVAPEVPGAERVIAAALATGVRISVGHTDATFEAAAQAFAAGASHVTHAFNAMRAWHHRDPGPLGAALHARDVTIEVIADGIHLHPSTVQLLVSAFGPDRITLVTDAVTPAALEAGTFRMGQEEARLRDGRMELPDGTIAGSAATMDALVRNVVRWGIADLATAVRMCTAVPAGVAGVAAQKGRIASGYDADLVVLEPEMMVAKTFVGGRLAHSR